METSAVTSFSQNMDNFNLKDLKILKTVGTGSFASVKLCKEKQSGKVYALKVMSIMEILKMKQVEHVKNEKFVLQV